MFLKVCLLLAVVPSTLAGGYFLTKTFDAEKVLGNPKTYLIVKAQKPKTQLYHNQAKTSEKLYANNKKNFRCVMSNDSSTATYDNGCEIYKLDNASATSPKIIDIAAINNIDRNNQQNMSVSDIKEDNFYVLKVDGYIFKEINNLSHIQLADMKEFPVQKEFANLRVEALLTGGGKKPAVNSGTSTPFSFQNQFKSKLMLVKLQAYDADLVSDNNLKCIVNERSHACEAWKITTQPTKDKEFKDLTLSSLDLIDVTTQQFQKDEYYILDINTRQVGFETKFSTSQTIQFSSDGKNPASENTFTVISGVLGTPKTSESNNKKVTLSQTDQLVFISSSNKIEV